jgi:hypothetical protein
MSATPSDHPQASDVQERLQHLEDRLAALEQHDLDGEIRARGLTIVDKHGTPRILLGAERGIASVLVRLDRPDGATNGVELFTWDDPDGGEPGCGLCVLRGGDVVAEWPAVDGREED